MHSFDPESDSPLHVPRALLSPLVHIPLSDSRWQAHPLRGEHLMHPRHTLPHDAFAQRSPLESGLRHPCFGTALSCRPVCRRQPFAMAFCFCVVNGYMQARSARARATRGRGFLVASKRGGERVRRPPAPRRTPPRGRTRRARAPTPPTSWSGQHWGGADLDERQRLTSCRLVLRDQLSTPGPTCTFDRLLISNLTSNRLVLLTGY